MSNIWYSTSLVEPFSKVFDRAFMVDPPAHFPTCTTHIVGISPWINFSGLQLKFSSSKCGKTFSICRHCLASLVKTAVAGSIRAEIPPSACLSVIK